MKNFFWVFALILSMLATSCSSTLTDELEQTTQTADLTFIVKPDAFQSSFSRATASDVLKQLDLALYTVEGGVYTKYADVKTSSSANNFGTVSVSNVAYGTYTLLAVGNASIYGGHADLSDIHQISFESDPLPVCYYACQQVSVNESSSTIALELKPACASFRLNMNGSIPQNTSKIVFSIKNASPFLDATTGLAPTGKIQDFDSSITISSSYWGQAGKSVRANMFLSAKDMSEHSGVTIKATAFDEDDNAIASYDLEDVPLKIGYITTYTGNFFQADNQGFSFTVNDNWGELSGSY